MKPTTEHTEHTDSANSKPKKGRSPVSIARYVAVWLGLVVLAVFWNLVFPTTGVLGTIGGWLGIAALGMTLVAFLWNLVESVRSLYYLRRVDRRTFWHCIAWIVLGCGATIAFSRWREASRDRAYQEVARFAEIQAKHKPTPATPSPAEEKHAESAENAEPNPHAEPAEGAE
jgi:hypothetical protein